jgi:hypothetical protein
MASDVLHVELVESLPHRALGAERQRPGQRIQSCALEVVLYHGEAPFDRVVLWCIGNVVDRSHVSSLLLRGVGVRKVVTRVVHEDRDWLAIVALVEVRDELREALLVDRAAVRVHELKTPFR